MTSKPVRPPGSTREALDAWCARHGWTPENGIAAAFPAGPHLSRAALDDLAARTRLYAIFITPRSGSTWLAEMAMRRGRIGTPHEWLNFEQVPSSDPDFAPQRLDRGITPTFESFLRLIVERRRSAENVMGMQLSFPQLRNWIELMEPGAPPALPLFYLRRRNLVAQAISLYRSVASGYWHSYQADPEAKARYAATAYDGERIAHWLRHIRQCESGFQLVFRQCGIEPLRLFYEDLAAQPDTVLGWMERILTGAAAPPPGGMALHRVSNEANAAWEARFRAEHAWLEGVGMGERNSLRSDCPRGAPPAGS